MKLHPENRLPVGIGGGVVLVGLIVVLASGGGSPDQLPLVADTTSPTTEPVTVTSADSASSPEGRLVAPLDCFSLLPDDAVEVALGIADQPWEQRGTYGRGKGETCVKQIPDDEDIFAGLEPGAPGDFAPGAELNGVTGEPVSGVGDVARWFGGTGAQGGILSVSQETSFGFLYFRISLGRPDLDGAARQEVARDLALAVLPRFPFVELEEPEPRLARVVPPPEPVDASSHGYVDNLLEKEADGEWTRGEGLVATLRLLVGEAGPNEVLRHPDLLDFGTEVISMAREYLEDSDDPTARSEIERLLAMFSQQPTPLEMAGSSRPLSGDDPTAQSDIRGLPAMFVPRPTPSETTGTSWRSVLAGAGRLTPILLQGADDECLQYYWLEDNCWHSFDIEPEKYGEGTYRLMGPKFGRNTGWKASHVDLFERATIKTIAVFHDLEIPPPPMDLVMTPHPGLGLIALGEPVGRCTVELSTGLQQLAARKQDQAEQAVATLIAQCSLKSDHFSTGSFAHDTWYRAGAIYLSDVVYPNAQWEREWKLPSQLADVETSKSMLEYDMPNWAFLEDVGSWAWALDILRAPATELGLASFGDLTHQYAIHLTSRRIADQGMNPHGYNPPARNESLSFPGPLTIDIKAFRAVRTEVSVDGGDYACVSFPPGFYLASWSPGSVGSATSWSQALPETLDGKSAFIVTSTKDSKFVLNVSKFVEDPEDCDKKEEVNRPKMTFLDLCGICKDPTAFLDKRPAGLG